jgi:AcrR family transcriptional regulator
MDPISRASGVSKATIYKHWKDKEDLLLDVLKHVNGLNERPNFVTGDTLRDIVAVLTYQPRENRSLREQLTPQVVAYSASRAEFGLIWRNTILDPPRRELREILCRAIDCGQIIRGLDMEIALAILLGPMLYSYVLYGKTWAGPREELAASVADTFLRAFGTTPAGN